MTAIWPFPGTFDKFNMTNTFNVTETMERENIGIVHVHNTFVPNSGGMTIAYRKCNEYTSGIMVEIAVATCSRLDTFNKKTGTKLAIDSFLKGNTILLPLLEGYASEDIAFAVKEKFKAMRRA